jgi:sulfonate transport system substrate-binding protein
VFALGAGASLKVVSIIHAEGRNTTALLVNKDSPIKTVADLKGKKIVTGRGSIGHYLAIKALATAGLTTKDVQFIFLLPSESRLVLDNGTADAWATWDPYTTVVTSQSQARVLISGNQLLSNHLYLAATSQAIADKRAQLDDFVARLDRAYAWANVHPNEYAAAQAKITGLPLEVHEAVAKDTRLTPVAIDDSVISGLQATADIYQKEGLLTQHIDVSQGFDKSFNAKRAPLNQASR